MTLLVSCGAPLGGCEGAGTAANVDGAPVGLGEACAPEQGCVLGLVCVDGFCAPRGGSAGSSLEGEPLPIGGDPWSVAEPAPDVAEPAADVADVQPDASLDAGDALTTDIVDATSTDASADTPGPSDQGGASVDADPSGGGDGAGSDVPPPPDVVVDAPGEGDAPGIDADAAVDVLEPGADDVGPDAPSDAVDAPDGLDGGGDSDKGTFLVLLKVDTADASKNGSVVIPTVGQTVVLQLAVPYEGTLGGLEVWVADPNGTPSCGLFRPRIWTPQEGGVYLPEADWVSSEVTPLYGDSEPEAFLLPDGPAIGPGLVRVGLEMFGDCEGGLQTPGFVSDSALIDGASWIHAQQTPEAPWIPAGILGVTGRFAIRLLVEVPVP